MIGVDAGSGDRLALGVLTQYRMATTEQTHRVIAPSVRIEQTRRRLAGLRAEGLVDRIRMAGHDGHDGRCGGCSPASARRRHRTWLGQRCRDRGTGLLSAG
jgi:hypothetical protein